MKDSPVYDYIIAGMGCAGLSLAFRLSQSDVEFKKILLIDRDLKNRNDRTWCFWSKEDQPWYEKIIYKKWEKFSFNSKAFAGTFSLGPYHYNMIRGIDFYEFCIEQLKKDPRFEIVTEEIIEIGTHFEQAFIKTERGKLYCKILFNSVFRNQLIQKKHLNYVQHFKGWLVESEEEVFDSTLPVFMDFDTPQDDDCRFFYVIPYSKKIALIEYTGFSKKALSEEVYDKKISDYLTHNYNISSYSILDSEKGEIPMAESAFINPYGEKVVNIGVSGGSSKPSTGYTFYFIQKNTEIILSQLKQKKKIVFGPERQKRFLWYDKILLDVLHNKKITAADVFSDLFKKNKIQDLLAFLNEESSLAEELRIMNSVNKKIFLLSAFKKLFGN